MIARIRDEQIALGNTRRAKRVCLNDIRPGLQETPMNVLNDFRLGDGKDVPVIQQVFVVIFEALAPGHSLIQQALGLVFPNGGAHRPIDHKNAIEGRGAKFVFDWRFG